MTTKISVGHRGPDSGKLVARRVEGSEILEEKIIGQGASAELTISGTQTIQVIEQSAVVTPPIEPPPAEPPVEEPVEPPPTQPPVEPQPITDSQSVRPEQFGAKGDGVTDDAAAIQAAWDKVMSGTRGGHLQFDGGRVYAVKTGLNLRNTIIRTGMIKVTGNGAEIKSLIDDSAILEAAKRQPILTIETTALWRNLRIEGLHVQGNTKEGHAISMITRGGHIYNWTMRDMVLSSCGGDGLRIIGNIFEAGMFGIHSRDHRGSGLYIADPKPEDNSNGRPTTLHVYESVFGSCHADGVTMANNYRDLSLFGVYMLENHKFGLYCSNGLTLAAACGWENNWHNASAGLSGYNVKLNNYGTFIGCTSGGNNGRQKGMVDAYLIGELTMTGCSASPPSTLGHINVAGGKKGKVIISGCSGLPFTWANGVDLGVDLNTIDWSAVARLPTT